ncbi:MAG: type VII secretion integral membrane protein EccD, partial [Mycobacterium sp.]|nr:type VII secretion integral membrane protein EccD [Mycobacterium sp.]
MTTVSFPARCAVAVVCGEHLVSQVYPASVPLEVFLDNVVELLSDDLKRRGAPPLDAGTAFELQRANGTRLDATKTLDELGVEDGATLVLVEAQPGESFEPQYESLSTGLAHVGRGLFAPVTAHTAAMTALAILGMMVATTLGLVVRTRLHTESWAIALVILTVAAALGLGAGMVWRWW